MRKSGEFEENAYMRLTDEKTEDMINPIVK
jgi:hypothetical protein